MITAYFVSRMMSQERNFSESRCFSQGVGCLFRCPTILMPPVDFKAKPLVLCNQDIYDVTISTTGKKKKTQQDGKNPDAKMNTIQYDERLIR